MQSDLFQDYRRRDKLLHELGYASYTDYLRSPTWRKVSARVMQRVQGRCEICGEPASEVHHLKYSEEVILRHKHKLRHLIAICRNCHRDGEFDSSGKVSRVEANQRMNHPGLKECPLCKQERAWTEFENFSGTQIYEVCKPCRRKKSNRKRICELGLGGMRAKYPVL